jgi:hypothetical protein
MQRNCTNFTNELNCARNVREFIDIVFCLTENKAQCMIQFRKLALFKFQNKYDIIMKAN